jgi:hypothetical protein
MGGLFKGNLNSVLVVVVVPPPVMVARLTILIVSITVTIVVIVAAIPVVVTVPIVIGVFAIRLGVPALEALAVVKAAKLVASRAGRIETDAREGVPPPYDQSVIEASSLFESLPTAVYPAIVITVAPPPVLGESG